MSLPSDDFKEATHILVYIPSPHHLRRLCPSRSRCGSHSQHGVHVDRADTSRCQVLKQVGNNYDYS